MEHVDEAATLTEQNRLFAQVVLSAQPQTPIPTSRVGTFDA
jgi:hypothetical protein